MSTLDLEHANIVGTQCCDNAKTDGATRLTYTGLRGGLEHLKRRPSIFKIIRSASSLTRIMSIFDFNWEENATRR
jgi:hypothetical protein